jgi:hypothetical protein
MAPQGPQRHRVGAGRPAETEVDAAGKQGCERAELLGDDVGRMVGQHDAAGANPDRPLPAATRAITSEVAAVVTAGMLWCSAIQKHR